MPNHFYGSYHWELTPVSDRIDLLDALRVFCEPDTNLFVESMSPSLLRRFSFWRMRSAYQTHLLTDTLSPRPSVFHLSLTEKNLDTLKQIVERDGLNERSLTHIKGYRGELGLFWFHGFCDQGDETLCCSRHVDDPTVKDLASRLQATAEKKYGELKSDRERAEYLDHMLEAMEKYRNSGQDHDATS